MNQSNFFHRTNEGLQRLDFTLSQIFQCTVSTLKVLWSKTFNVVIDGNVRNQIGKRSLSTNQKSFPFLAEVSFLLVEIDESNTFLWILP